MATTEADMGFGSCLADTCPNIDRRLMVGERISDEVIEACCELDYCIYDEPVSKVQVEEP